MSKRIEYIDIAKGIGIILVVFGHSITAAMRENSFVAQFVYNYIYSFHRQSLPEDIHICFRCVNNVCSLGILPFHTDGNVYGKCGKSA